MNLSDLERDQTRSNSSCDPHPVVQCDSSGGPEEVRFFWARIGNRHSKDFRRLKFLRRHEAIPFFVIGTDGKNEFTVYQGYVRFEKGTT